MSLPWRQPLSHCLRMSCLIDPPVGLPAPTPSNWSTSRRCSIILAAPRPPWTPSPRPPTTDFLGTRPRRTMHGGALGPRNLFGPIPRSNGSNGLSRSSSKTRPRGFCCCRIIHPPARPRRLTIGAHWTPSPWRITLFRSTPSCS